MSTLDHHGAYWFDSLTEFYTVFQYHPVPFPCVYLMRSWNQDIYKIGKSINVLSRQRQLSSTYKGPFQFLGCFPCPSRDYMSLLEEELHNHWSEQRDGKTEMFTLTREQLQEFVTLTPSDRTMNRAMDLHEAKPKDKDNEGWVMAEKLLPLAYMTRVLNGQQKDSTMHNKDLPRPNKPINAVKLSLKPIYRERDAEVGLPYLIRKQGQPKYPLSLVYCSGKSVDADPRCYFESKEFESDEVFAWTEIAEIYEVIDNKAQVAKARRLQGETQ